MVFLEGELFCEITIFYQMLGDPNIFQRHSETKKARHSGACFSNPTWAEVEVSQVQGQPGLLCLRQNNKHKAINMCQQEAVLIGWANSSTGGLLQVLQQKADAKVSHPMSGSASWHIWGGVWTQCPGSLTDEYVLNGDLKLSPRQCYDSGSGDDGSCEVKAFFITHFGFHTGGTACAHIPKNNNCIFFKSSRVTQSCQDRI